MESTPRNISTADDLDSTILRHQVQRYFNELQQDSNLSDTPLNMDFLLGQKRKPLNQSAASKAPAPDSLLPKRIRYDITSTSISSINNSFTHTAALKNHHDQELSEVKAQMMNLQQKVIQLEMKLSETETSRTQLRLSLTHVEDACKSQIRQHRDKIEDLQAEIVRHKLVNSDLSRANTETKESMEKLKIDCAEEKLARSRQTAAVEEETEEMRVKFETEIVRLKKDLESGAWEVKKYQLEVEEARKQLELKEKVVAVCDHEVVIEQQQQVIREMENALFSQRAVFSKSHEAKLAKIPQVKHFNHFK